MYRPAEPALGQGRGGGVTLQGEGAQHALGPWYTGPSQKGQGACLRSSCQQPFGGPRHTPGLEQSGRGMRHILSPKCIKIVGQVTSPNARQTNNWGGGNWEHPNIGTAKFGAEEIWPQFLISTARFGVNSQIVAQQAEAVNGGCCFLWAFGAVISDSF